MEPSVGYIAAFFGGLVSFLSPCVLPLVPAYLAVISGVSIGDLTEGSHKLKMRIFRDTMLFITGFSVVFVLLGLSLNALRNTLVQNSSIVSAISGALVIGMAIFLLVSQLLNSPRLLSEYRFHPQLSRFGIFAAPVTGAAFAFGWTPCIGPVLTSILAISATQDQSIRGAMLLASYSLGLGIPFLFTGIAFGKLTSTLNWFKRHGRELNVVAAFVMGTFGLLLLLDRFTYMTSQLQTLLRSIGFDSLITLG